MPDGQMTLSRSLRMAAESLSLPSITWFLGLVSETPVLTPKKVNYDFLKSAEKSLRLLDKELISTPLGRG